MPHLTLEYTANVPPPDDLAYMLLSMHKVLSDTGGIKIENCKSRMRYTDTFIIGEGDPLGAFLHLDVSFLEGRIDDIKMAIESNDEEASLVAPDFSLPRIAVDK